MNTATVRPLELQRWPEGDRHNLPFLVTILCPVCAELHTHPLNARAVGSGHTWTCTTLLRRGRYRLAVLPTLNQMWDLVAA